MKFSLVIVLFGFCVSLAHGERKLEFNRDIRPILSDGCFHCHGPDEKERKSGLRLDLGSDAFKPAKSGFPAIIKGNAEESELITRIFLPDNDDDHMPPLDSGKSITKEQKETLRKWIAQGANYQGHWAFLAPERPEVPVHSDAKHPVDAFLNTRLKAEGLSMKKEADKETLLRRASLDLTGLPPTLEEMDAFAKDSSPNAYEKALDRLLVSPHFGERMALEWLDLARYADSNGFQSDGSRDMWLWREWLIDAYNRNLPFDQFTIEQLAGDMLPDATEDQIVATGFNRNHRLNGEGGRIVDEWFVETVIDRVETTSTTWLALTMTCARCHDHKYDPISQKEFYEFFAFFNSNEESGVLAANGKNGNNTMPFIKVASKDHKKRQAELEAKLKEAEQAAELAQKADLTAAFEKWLVTERKAQASNKDKPVWVSFSAESVKSKGGATLKKQADGSWLASGKNPSGDVYEISAPVQAGRLAGVLMEVFPDKSLPNQSLGRGSNGNFVLTGVQVAVHPPKGKPVVLDIKSAKSDYDQASWEVTKILKNSQNLNKAGSLGWAINGNEKSKRVPRKAMFLAAEPVEIKKGSKLVLSLHHKSQFGDHNVGRFRLSLTADKGASLDGKPGLSPEISSLLAKAGVALKPAESAKLEKHFKSTAPNPATQAQTKVAQAKKAIDNFKNSLPSTMIMKEKAQPKDAFILTRGEYDQPTDKVGRGLPAVLPPLAEGDPVNRLGLARWLVSGDHPLTGRVWVNRMWERLFGYGIVKTSENFGSQAEWPMHPELLDWLAVEFAKPTVLPKVDGKPSKPWDMKGMIKFIMMSRAYRQSSSAPEELYLRDPENRLLARGPRFRLTGELVRDQALAVSGLLVNKLGGPSVRPYMPVGVWSETNRYGNLKNYKADTGAGLFRRSMYTIWKRTAAPPSMLLFDAPNREICMPKRSRTNTPLQALALMNEVTYVEAARALAQRMMKEGGDSVESRLTIGFRLVTARTPDADTLKVLKSGFERRKKEFEKEPERAKAFITQGSSKPDPSLAAPELAAYSATASILLNLDRVITKD
jgi:hypothetical protein